MKESDFKTALRLESGIKLWQGMWEYRAPAAQCFIVPVKPRARQMLNQTSTPPSGEVFLGRKPSTDNQTNPSPQSTSFTETTRNDDDVSFFYLKIFS